MRLQDATILRLSGLRTEYFVLFLSCFALFFLPVWPNNPLGVAVLNCLEERDMLSGEAAVSHRPYEHESGLPCRPAGCERERGILEADMLSRIGPNTAYATPSPSWMTERCFGANTMHCCCYRSILFLLQPGWTTKSALPCSSACHLPPALVLAVSHTAYLQDGWKPCPSRQLFVSVLSPPSLL